MEELLRTLAGIFTPMIKASLNEKGLAKLILRRLGPEEEDKETARLMDESVKGGIIFEAADGPAAKYAVKKLRKWAEEKSKE